MSATNPVASTGVNNPLQNYLNQQAQTIASSTASTSGTANGTNTLEGISGNFTTFLSILTTQLTHQDPTSATDPNQFTQELVQFAGVEQQLNTNSDLQTLINLQKSSGGLATNLGYIGGYVQVPSTTKIPLQNGGAELAYTLPAGATNATITMMDSTGKVVNTLPAATNAGTNYVTWDGKDTNGTQLADGTYTFQINATSSNGSVVTPTNVSVFGLVTSVQSNADGTASVDFGNGGMTANSSTITAVYSSTSIPPATALPTT